MAWGIWNKIKNGIKKVAGTVGKAAGWVADKALPVIRPIAGAVAPVLNAFAPGLGTAINAGVDYASKGISKLKGVTSRFGSGGSGIRKDIPTYNAEFSSSGSED
jgi:hypothetical protein